MFGLKEWDLRVQATEIVRTLERRGVLARGLAAAPARALARDRAQTALRIWRNVRRRQQRRDALEHVDLGGES